MRRSLLVVLLASLLTMAGASAAFADPDPVAGCGRGFTLDTVGVTIEQVDFSPYPEEEWPAVEAAITAEDRNNDGYLCWKQYKPNRGQDKFWGVEDYVITLILDNNAKGRQ